MSVALARVTVLVGALVLAWVAVGWWERRRPRRKATGLRPGLVLVVGSSCRLCPAAIERLASQSPALTVLDAADRRVRALGIRSVPTALVVASDGRPLLRRSGRAVLADAELLTSRARSAQ